MEKNYSKTVLKALDILEELSEAGENISNAAIAKRLNLNTSTTHRILNTLASKGYVGKENGLYRMGHKVLNLKYLTSQDSVFRQRAHPLLAELEESTDLTVTLAIREGFKAIPIDIITGYNNLVVNHNLGRPVPLHASSVGKCLIAFLPNLERNEIVKRLDLKRFTSHTITSKDQLMEELDLIKERGYATDGEEFVAGIRCVGSPIFGYQQQILAAASVAGLTGQFAKQTVEKIAEKVIKTSKNISSFYHEQNRL